MLNNNGCLEEENGRVLRAEGCIMNVKTLFGFHCEWRLRENTAGSCLQHLGELVNPYIILLSVTLHFL